MRKPEAGHAALKIMGPQQDHEIHQKQGSPKDDDGHDVVAADVGGAGEEDQHDEDHAAGHHRHCVETARQEVDNPVKIIVNGHSIYDMYSFTSV